MGVMSAVMVRATQTPGASRWRMRALAPAAAIAAALTRLDSRVDQREGSKPGNCCDKLGDRKVSGRKAMDSCA